MPILVEPKSIVVRRIDAETARKFCVLYHYSKKVVQNSVLNFGCFYNNILHGVIMYGHPLDKRKVINLVHDTKWNELLEINRVAFDDFLPRNSESRCLAVSIRLIKKYAPHIRWILSFADAGLCGDGAIYRACGFLLAGFKKTSSMLKLKNGSYIHEMTFHSQPTRKMKELGGKSFFEISGGQYIDIKVLAEMIGAEVVGGYQFKYVYLIDKKSRINFEPLPYDIIDRINGGMYKGVNITRLERRTRQWCNSSTPVHQTGDGGASPTLTLESQKD